MIDRVGPQKCVLCKACGDICPVDAIDYVCEGESFGFLYPVIKKDICLKCGRCETVCPVIHPPDATRETAYAFAAKSTDELVRMNSSSGGIFSSLAHEMMRQKGYVSGCVFDEQFSVKHILSDKEADIARMRGSKYVNSDLTGIYREIRDLLVRGETVLFCGCPCQAAALRTFLQKKYDGLFVVDLICHGVPGPEAWRQYRNYMEKRYRAKVMNVHFRSKETGWHLSSLSIQFSNGRVYRKPILADAYMKGYFSGITLKESCYSCSFNQYTSGSDMTLGDFWGAETVLRNRDDNKGVSALIVHTEKGLSLLERIKDHIELEPCDLESIEKYNRNLIDSTPRNPMRDEVYTYWDQYGYEKMLRKFFLEKRTAKVCRVSRRRIRILKNKIFKGEEVLY